MKVLVLSLLLLIAGCSSTRYFRELNPEEKAALAQSRKQVTLNDGCYHVLVMTDAGNMILKLYNETPLHRDNLVDKIKSGFYDSLIFHRVINNFVIQGGDPTSKRATGDAKVGEGEGPGPKIPAEFRTEQGIYHKRGALGMARDNNPEKASSNAQFYIVQRRAYRPAQLDSLHHAGRHPAFGWRLHGVWRTGVGMGRARQDCRCKNRTGRPAGSGCAHAVVFVE